MDAPGESATADEEGDEAGSAVIGLNWKSPRRRSAHLLTRQLMEAPDPDEWEEGFLGLLKCEMLEMAEEERKQERRRGVCVWKWTSTACAMDSIAKLQRLQCSKAHRWSRER